jgi:hypothetical protein
MALEPGIASAVAEQNVGGVVAEKSPTPTTDSFRLANRAGSIDSLVGTRLDRVGTSMPSALARTERESHYHAACRRVISASAACPISVTEYGA